MKDGDIIPSLFNNGIKGMGLCICQDSAASILEAGGGGQKSPAKR